MSSSPLATDALPFADVAEAIRWAFAHLAGPDAFDAVYVPAERLIPRPATPERIRDICDEVIARYRIDEAGQTLIFCAGLGQLTPEQIVSPKWQAIEALLLFHFAAKAIVQLGAPGDGAAEEPTS
jgi:hypothetical protein